MRLNRETLQRLARQRRREASTLIRQKQYPGAYYLMGYSIECALKARIAKQTVKYDFPDKKLARDAYTHDLERLVKLAGLWTDLEREMRTNKVLEVNWATVKDWSEDARYELQITRRFVADFYSACAARTHGILSCFPSA